jgi:hypothetical protein
MEPIRCTETSVKDYHTTLLRYIPEDFLTLEDGTDTLSRNAGKNCHTTLRNISEER